MYLMVFSGPLGSGKTLGMSLIAQLYREKSGCTLYSNYGLTNSKLFTSFEQFSDVAMQPSSIICLDEAHTDLDSRSSTTSISRYMTHVIFYLRKMRATMMMTTPMFDNLDARVRMLCDIYVHVEKDKHRFKYHMYDVQSGNKLKTYSIKKERAFALNAYDTHKMVIPMEFPKDKNEYESIIKNLKDVNDSYFMRQAAHEPWPEVAEGAAEEGVELTL